MDVPRTPAEVTATWLESVLAGDPRFADVDWHLVDQQQIGQGFGLDGTLLRITIAAQTPASLVLKLAQWPPPSEPDFYRRIAPVMPARVPECYAAVQDDTHFALLLEDLGDATQGDSLVGTDEVKIERLFRATARFHAKFWGGHNDLLSGCKPFRFDPAGASPARIALQGERMLERFPFEPGSEAERVLAELPERASHAAAVLDAAPSTLIHSDLHLDNVLFVGDEPVILDWPSAKVGPAAIDVGRMLIETMTLHQRRERQSRLLAAYRSELADHGIKLDHGRFDDEIAAALVWMRCLAVSWAGATDEDLGLDRPRVAELVQNLLRNTFAEASDSAT